MIVEAIEALLAGRQASTEELDELFEAIARSVEEGDRCHWMHWGEVGEMHLMHRGKPMVALRHVRPVPEYHGGLSPRTKGLFGSELYWDRCPVNGNLEAGHGWLLTKPTWDSRCKGKLLHAARWCIVRVTRTVPAQQVIAVLQLRRHSPHKVWEELKIPPQTILTDLQICLGKGVEERQRKATSLAEFAQELHHLGRVVKKATAKRYS